MNSTIVLFCYITVNLKYNNKGGGVGEHEHLGACAELPRPRDEEHCPEARGQVDPSSLRPRVAAGR